MQRSVWIQASAMKIVVIKLLKLGDQEEFALLEPLEVLMTSKKISRGKILIPGIGTGRNRDFNLDR